MTRTAILVRHLMGRRFTLCNHIIVAVHTLLAYSFWTGVIKCPRQKTGGDVADATILTGWHVIPSRHTSGGSSIMT